MEKMQSLSKFQSVYAFGTSDLWMVQECFTVGKCPGLACGINIVVDGFFNLSTDSICNPMPEVRLL